MARKATFSHAQFDQANPFRNSAKNLEELQRALSVLLMTEGRMEAGRRLPSWPSGSGLFMSTVFSIRIGPPDQHGVGIGIVS